MKKKLLIAIFSVTALLLIGSIILGIILIPNNKDTNPDAANNPISSISSSLTDSTVSNVSSQNSDTSSSVSKPSDVVNNDEKYQDRAERITAAYEYVNEFTNPKYKLLQYDDSTSGKTIPYWLYIPDDYNPNEKYPVLFYLHGAGEIGNGDALPLTHLRLYAFPNNGDILRRAIIVVPQTPGGWSISSGSANDTGWLAIAMRALFDVENTYSCDLDRIYVVGVSMGSFATWNALACYSDHFAAAVPVCGGTAAYMAYKFVDVPIWIFHGTADGVVHVSSSDSVYNALISAGSTKVKYSRLEGVEHNIWEKAFRQRELWSWMFSQNKSTNKDASYSMFDYITVETSKGRVLFNQTGISGSTLTFNNEYPTLKVEFTDSAMKAIKTAYNKNNNEEFTLYIGRKKLFSFKFVYEPTDNSVFLIDIYSENDCYTIGPILSDVYT